MFAKEDPSTRKTRSCKSRNINATWPQSFSASLTSFNLEKFSRSFSLVARYRPETKFKGFDSVSFDLLEIEIGKGDRDRAGANSGIHGL